MLNRFINCILSFLYSFPVGFVLKFFFTYVINYTKFQNKIKIMLVPAIFNNNRSYILHSMRNADNMA